MHPDEIRYALSKQVPDIAYWATFSTSYGELQLTGADARRIAALVERILETKLRQAERMAERIAKNCR